VKIWIEYKAIFLKQKRQVCISCGNDIIWANELIKVYLETFFQLFFSTGVGFLFNENLIFWGNCFNDMRIMLLLRHASIWRFGVCGTENWVLLIG
jgi:hypothetical protein